MEINLEDIVLWIIILLIISLAVWLMFGSPTDTASIIAIAIFVAGSEILIWKSLFKNNEKIAIKFEKLDKKTSISFEKVKSRFDKVDLKLENINSQLNRVENLIKK